jgi:hypothetical protein
MKKSPEFDDVGGDGLVGQRHAYPLSGDSCALGWFSSCPQI